MRSNTSFQKARDCLVDHHGTHGIEKRYQLGTLPSFTVHESWMMIAFTMLFLRSAGSTYLKRFSCLVECFRPSYANRGRFSGPNWPNLISVRPLAKYPSRPKHERQVSEHSSWNSLMVIAMLMKSAASATSFAPHITNV